MKYLLLLIACVLSGILYRLGGAHGYNTKFRDIGCPLVLLGLVCGLFGLKMVSWWAYLLTFGLSWGALSSYHYFLPKPKDNLWYHYSLHGFFCGLAGLSLVWCGVPLYVLIIRTTVLTLGMGLWSKVGNDVWEERGRGVLFII